MKTFSAFAFLGFASGTDWNGWVCTSNSVTVSLATSTPIISAPPAYLPTSGSSIIHTEVPAIQNASTEIFSSTSTSFSITRAVNYSTPATTPFAVNTGEATTCAFSAVGGACNPSPHLSAEPTLLPNTTTALTTAKQGSANPFTNSPLSTTGSSFSVASKPTVLVSTGAAAQQLTPKIMIFTWSSSWALPSFGAAALLLAITAAI